MKVHYINILLFALPLNILLLSSQVYNQKNHKSTILLNTTKIPTNRCLCECELYAPSNYDNDPQMKELMEIFNQQTLQRFEEYEERMKSTRQKCKDQCDKEIQKIILKDKLEKQMAEQLTTLDTKITTGDIPTCICEKSLADKVEKGCLRCGSVLGGGVMPGFAAIGGTTLYALNPLKLTAISNAIAEALELNADKISAGAIKAGNAHGTTIVTYFLEQWGIKDFCPDLFKSIGTTTRYTNAEEIANSILGKFNVNCMSLDTGFKASAGCNEININFGIFSIDGNPGPPANYIIPKTINGLVGKAKQGAAEAAKKASESATAAISKKQTALIEAGFNNSITAIYASIIAILIIVLIMVIIYLILRYRRKKKMKKKLQYIKLLEE